MKKNIISGHLILLVITALISPAVLALEVDREVMPRIQLGGRVLATVDAPDLDSEPDAETLLNLSDSSLLARFDKRSYREGVAGAIVGITEHDEAITFHQLNAFYWNRDYAVTLGRSRLRNTILELPLMRDDDLLGYTHVGNASSDEEFDQIYGKQLSFDLFIDQKVQRIGIWTAARRNGAVYANAPDGFDTVGASYIFEQPEDLRYVKWLRHAGILVDGQKVKTTSGDDWNNAILAGIETNLNLNPRNNWSLAGQAIFNQGISGTPAVVNLSATEFNSLVLSMRYTARPKLLTRYQAGLSFAYKDYADINKGNQWSVVTSAFYKLGQGIDVLAQFAYTDYGEGLGGGSDTTAQVGMAFSFDAMFNDTIGERDSILNLEHGYIQ